MGTVILTQPSSLLRCGPERLTQPRASVWADGCGEPHLFSLSASGVAMATLHGSPICSLPPSPKQKAIRGKGGCLGAAWQATGSKGARVQLILLIYFQEILNCQAQQCSWIPTWSRPASSMATTHACPQAPSPPRHLPGELCEESAGASPGTGRVPTHCSGAWLPAA